ncbi:MAG: chorismate lyase [Gammaproteobacteria bacterium]|nr:chorismate lyase [Gammaproteobacteria bacterium]
MSLTYQQPDTSQQVSWKPVDALTDFPGDEDLLAIVSLSGSLTRRLRELCGGGFRLQLLGEQTGPGQQLLREVLMSCGDSPWVFAQTVIPQNTLAANPWIGQLGERPLGDTLFDRPGVERSDLYIARLHAGHALFDRAINAGAITNVPDYLIARRSVIQFVDSELTINEIFFPEVGQAQRHLP